MLLSESDKDIKPAVQRFVYSAGSPAFHYLPDFLMTDREGPVLGGWLSGGCLAAVTGY